MKILQEIVSIVKQKGEARGFFFPLPLLYHLIRIKISKKFLHRNFYRNLILKEAFIFRSNFYDLWLLIFRYNSLQMDTQDTVD
jgi:hypothetical protein